MNWEGRVTHSQGDGVAHVSKTDTSYHPPHPGPGTALQRNLPPGTSLLSAFFLPTFVRLPYLHRS